MMSSKKIIGIGFIACIVPVFVFAQGYYDQWGNWKSGGGNNGGRGWSWWTQPRQQPQQQPRSIPQQPRGAVSGGISSTPSTPQGIKKPLLTEVIEIQLVQNTNGDWVYGGKDSNGSWYSWKEGVNLGPISLNNIKNSPAPFYKNDLEKNQIVASSPWGVDAPVGKGATTIIKFSAKWCKPCKTLKKTIDGIKNPGFEVLEVDIEDPYSDETVAKMEELHISRDTIESMLPDIKNLPAMVGLDKKGVIIGMVTGVKNEEWFGYAVPLRKSELSDELPVLPPAGDNSAPSPFSPTKEETDKPKPAKVTPNTPAKVDDPFAELSAEDKELLKKIEELERKIKIKEEEAKKRAREKNNAVPSQAR